MINNTNIKIPQEYQKYIYEINRVTDDDRRFYEVYLEDCCRFDDESGYNVYYTKAEIIADLKNVRVMTEAEYIKECGEDGLDDFRESLERVMGE